MMPPMIKPPMAPMPRMGAKAFVTIALGKLSRRPTARPTTHPGHGSATQPITTPIAKRSMNAAVNAAVLSGNESGIIVATASAPKTKPETMPSEKLDMTIAPPWLFLALHALRPPAPAPPPGNRTPEQSQEERGRSQKRAGEHHAAAGDGAEAFLRLPDEHHLGDHRQDQKQKQADPATVEGRM